MPEFLSLISSEEAFQRLISNLVANLGEEEIGTTSALNRITAHAIIAHHPLPAFPRATVDGYAVMAEDTFGASDSLPAYLSLKGEILMGDKPEIELDRGFCALIHTGGMVPKGANAVVMIEDTQMSYGDEIEIVRSVAPGENIIQVGEDIVKGEEIFPKGKKIRSVEIGGLMALGLVSLNVVKQPQFGIISTGDELVNPDQLPTEAQVRDINSYTLSTIINQAGGRSTLYGIMPDNYEEIIEMARSAINECDGLVITAGSSASSRDITAQIINDLGEPGVLVHGIKLKPGKPTIIGVCRGKPVFGLPGNPVSCIIAGWLFVVPAIKYLLGEKNDKSSRLKAIAANNIHSKAGIEEWIPVKLKQTGTPDNHMWTAYPIFSRSNLIFSLIKADGLARIPIDMNGVEAGELIDVVLID